MVLTECSEMSEYKIQMQGNHPKERIRHSENGESLKSRNVNLPKQRLSSQNFHAFPYTNMSLMFIGPCIVLIVEWRETNLMSLALLFHYLMLNMFRMLIHPSSRACDLFVELFHGLYCSVRIEVFALAYVYSDERLVMTCVVVLESVFLPAANIWRKTLSKTTTHVTTNHSPLNNAKTSDLTEQYNPWNNSTNKSQALEDGCINIRNMLSIK